jgi:hypothetical protein
VDAFAVLGLPYDPDLTDAEVRSAYLVRLRAVHPDNGGDSGCAAAVTAAYDALRSGVRRGELLAAVTVAGDGVLVPVPLGAAGWLRARAARPPRESEEGRGAGGRPGPVRMAELRRRVAVSRAEQGLPPFITDEATLARIVDLLVVMERRDGGPVAGLRERSAGVPVRLDAGERAGSARRVPAGGGWWVRGWLRVRWGRPGWLVGRVVVAVGVVVVAVVVAAGDPAVWGLGVGALTWVVRTGRWDLAPGVRR